MIDLGKETLLSLSFGMKNSFENNITFTPPSWWHTLKFHLSSSLLRTHSSNVQFTMGDVQWAMCNVHNPLVPIAVNWTINNLQIILWPLLGILNCGRLVLTWGKGSPAILVMLDDVLILYCEYQLPFILRDIEFICSDQVLSVKPWLKRNPSVVFTSHLVVNQ